jgi:hypothetical protein
MRDDRSTITVPRDAFAKIVDSIQRAIIDKGASKATRKAAFSALLALIDAGLIVGDTSIGAPARESTGAPAKDKTGATQAQVRTRQLLAG